MYELINNEMSLIEEVSTPNQTAIVKTHYTMVEGYDLEVAIMFDEVPEKIEQEGKFAKLSYVEGSLVWQYTDISVEADLLARVEELEVVIDTLVDGEGA